MLARRLKKKFSLKELENIFLESSKDLNGTICVKELKSLLKYMEIDLTNDEIEEIVMNEKTIIFNLSKSNRLLISP
jgi:Ca2+-binding EF-hand superfamily protein